MKTLREIEKENTRIEICKNCPRYKDFGNFEEGWHYPQYIADWECELGTEPRNEDCCRHEDYVSKVG